MIDTIWAYEVPSTAEGDAFADFAAEKTKDFLRRRGNGSFAARLSTSGTIEDFVPEELRRSPRLVLRFEGLA